MARLVTEDKILTKRSLRWRAARRGYAFAVTSGRHGSAWPCCSDALDVETPIAGLDSLFVERDLTDPWTKGSLQGRATMRLMRAHGLDTWVYSGNNWLNNQGGPHSARHREA